MDDKTIIREQISFEPGTAKLLPASYPMIDGAAAILEEYSRVRLRIVAHVNDVGDRKQNIELSRRRAEAVKAYLVAKGVASSRLETHGAGPDQPIADNGTASGRLLNQRIEFELLPD